MQIALINLIQVGILNNLYDSTKQLSCYVSDFTSKVKGAFDFILLEARVSQRTTEESIEEDFVPIDEHTQRTLMKNIPYHTASIRQRTAESAGMPRLSPKYRG